MVRRGCGALVAHASSSAVYHASGGRRGAANCIVDRLSNRILGTEPPTPGRFDRAARNSDGVRSFACQVGETGPV